MKMVWRKKRARKAWMHTSCVFVASEYWVASRKLASGGVQIPMRRKGRLRRAQPKEQLVKHRLSIMMLKIWSCISWIELASSSQPTVRATERP